MKRTAHPKKGCAVSRCPAAVFVPIGCEYHGGVGRKLVRWAFMLEHYLSPIAHDPGWPYPLGKGQYGTVWDPVVRREVRVHRAVAILVHGDPPAPGLEAAHTCGRAWCFYGPHIRWATPGENIADRARHGTTAYGLDNGRAKLTDDQVREIRRRADAGERHIDLAREFGVTGPTITNIANRKRRTHVE